MLSNRATAILQDDLKKIIDYNVFYIFSGNSTISMINTSTVLRLELAEISEDNWRFWVHDRSP